MSLPDLSGKTALVTGATSGIGFECAVLLAGRGARVLIVGRNAEKSAAAVAELTRRVPDARVESLLCDFSKQASIRALAADVLTRCERLDILVNNAGGVSPDRKLTEDGIEETFAVNHLGYFLLTHLLVDRVVASAPARIVNVSSRGHYRGSMDFDDLGFEKGYSIMGAYMRSKLGNVLFTRRLAKELEGKGVTVNALHPGEITSQIWDKAPGWTQPFLWVAKLFMDDNETGGSRVAYLAASEEVAGKTGLYFTRNQEKTVSALAQDDSVADRLWGESARLVGVAAAPPR